MRNQPISPIATHRCLQSLHHELMAMSLLVTMSVPTAALQCMSRDNDRG